MSSTTNFRNGSLSWSAVYLDAEEISTNYLDNTWQDGFAAFSNGEQRLALNNPADDLKGWLSGQADLPDELEGYVMEAGIWRNTEVIFEELALERDGDRFFVQYWRLTARKTQKEGELPCYFRRADTYIRGNLHGVFPENDITTIEVVVPEDRLRFYMTEEAVYAGDNN